MIRIFDILFSFIGILVLLPLLLVIAAIVSIEGKGSPLYIQTRIGKDEKEFKLYKFRSMYFGADKGNLLLTIGEDDKRITRVGYYIRKYKIDELPQLYNVLKGDMSMVGPRPQTKKYARKYTKEQKKVFRVKPGITDYASIAYINESEILVKYADPEQVYIEKIVPIKVRLNKRYIDDPSIKNYFNIIFLTIYRILKWGKY